MVEIKSKKSFPYQIRETMERKVGFVLASFNKSYNLSNLTNRWKILAAIVIKMTKSDKQITQLRNTHITSIGRGQSRRQSATPSKVIS